MSLDVPGPQVGDIAPDFMLEEADGGSIQLAGLRGRPVVLIFFRGGW